MRISDWGSDVCASDRRGRRRGAVAADLRLCDMVARRTAAPDPARLRGSAPLYPGKGRRERASGAQDPRTHRQGRPQIWRVARSEEHTSELQSLMRNSYAVFCLKKKNTQTIKKTILTTLKHKNSNITHNTTTRHTKPQKTIIATHTN